MRKLVLRRPETSEVIYRIFNQISYLTFHRWSAVIRGAVLSGMEKTSRLDQMTVQMCARSFGISIASSFSRRMHDSRDVYTNPITGQVQAKGQIMWLARKGDLLLPREPRTIEHTLHWNFLEGKARHVSLPIFQYPDDDLPDRYETAHEGTIIFHENNTELC